MSKCIIGQWPLKTIKSYESTGRGHFGLESGRFAPMGEGHYSFSTRVTQDVLIYDTLDKYVMEAAGLREVVYLKVISEQLVNACVTLFVILVSDLNKAEIQIK